MALAASKSSIIRPSNIFHDTFRSWRSLSCTRSCSYIRSFDWIYPWPAYKLFKMDNSLQQNFARTIGLCSKLQACWRWNFSSSGEIYYIQYCSYIYFFNKKRTEVFLKAPKNIHFWYFDFGIFGIRNVGPFDQRFRAKYFFILGKLAIS